MEKSLTISYVILILLTILGTTLAITLGSAVAAKFIVLFSLTKFLIVGFQFMDLKEAHYFWKILYCLYTVVIGVILLFLL